MNIKQFYHGIKLMPQAVAELDNLNVSSQTYTAMKKLFYTDQNAFFQQIKGRPDSRILFLYYYCHLAAECYEKYMENGWDEQIYWDTFSDITIWCGNCVRDYGEYGIEQYEWLFRHVKFTLFRLGRLQYEMCPIDRDVVYSGGMIKKGDAVIHIHIPQGKPLDIEACVKSAAYAREFFSGGDERPFVCHSWLLYPGLNRILPETSNIIRFQRLFEITGTDFDTREAEERIFTKKQSNPFLYPEHTILQKGAKKILINGEKLGSGFGVLSLV